MLAALEISSFVFCFGLAIPAWTQERERNEFSLSVGGLGADSGPYLGGPPSLHNRENAGYEASVLAGARYAHFPSRNQSNHLAFGVGIAVRYAWSDFEINTLRSSGPQTIRMSAPIETAELSLSLEYRTKNSKVDFVGNVGFGVGSSKLKLKDDDGMDIFPRHNGFVASLEGGMHFRVTKSGLFVLLEGGFVALDSQVSIQTLVIFEETLFLAEARTGVAWKF
jgi:hypothetical protein